MGNAGRSALSKTTVVVDSAREGSSTTLSWASLVIAWSAAEPHRFGEAAFLAQPGTATPTWVLGRGEAEEPSEQRLAFFRQRPGKIEPTPPLESPGLSRRQLLIESSASGAKIQRIGRCALEVNGRRCDEAEIAPGDVIHLRKELVLVCVSREMAIPPERLFDRSLHGAFGMADRLGLLGESPRMWQLRERLAFAAKSDTHVLVLGASGTGKELAARAIHALSSRDERAFVARNAATLPPGLMDAELFGNAKNYPNPGMAERGGLIGEADGGTLFLDEIGELPSELQAHLLRVLDSDGEYQRLGEARMRRSQLRLVAATNRDAGSLKHDFAARFTARVEVPSLDDRREDIAILLNHLVLRAASRSPQIAGRFVTRAPDGRAIGRVDPQLVVHVLRRAYPTNIRDLDAVLWAAMAESHGEVIELPVALRAPGEPPIPSQPEPSSRETPRASQPEPTSGAGRGEPTADEIRAALATAGGSVPRAASHLGLSSRYVLYRLMKKHGIDAGREEEE